MKKINVIIYSVLISVIFAFFVRGFFGLGGLYSVMTVSFLLLLPFGVGYLTIFFCRVKAVQTKSSTIGLASTPVFIFLLLTIIFSIEGAACWIMVLPVFLIASALGGLSARYFKLKKSNRDKAVLSLVVLLPFLLAPIEHMIGAIPGTYQAYTEINISANKEQIWQNVTRVKTIEKQQDKAVFTRALGFPPAN
jgi:hypothetical protein